MIYSLPPLSFDLITEILSRLPVKLLLQFQCVCKSWNSLISDPKFTKKHLTNSTTTSNLHFISYDDPARRYVLKSYPLQSVFEDINSNLTQLGFPFKSPSKPNLHYTVGSCDGILCVADFHNSFVVLWNPSIRKFKKLSPFENQRLPCNVKYGFGYDHVSHNYKLVVLYDSNSYSNGIPEDTTKIKVYTLSTNSWGTIPALPFSTDFSCNQSGIYVNGTVNWLAYTKWPLPLFIVSFDLGKESYQKIFIHEHESIDGRMLKLCVLRDCLCIMSYYDVWVMKEYGVKESLTKLFEFSNLQHQCISSSFLTKALYIFEDDQVLLQERWKQKLIIYDIKKDTFKVIGKFQSFPTVCIESLISPCS